MAQPYALGLRAVGVCILALFCVAFCLPVPGQEQPPATEAERIHVSGLQQALGWNDVKVAVANMLLEVKAGTMTPEIFYQRLSRMDTGKEPRFFLMELKSEVADYRGGDGLKILFGDPYPGGGSYVEHKILSWRRDFVTSLIRDVVRQFQGRTTVDGVDYKVFYSEVGSWSKEKWNEMKLAGDIDFSFLCGNRDLALQMKQAFDKLVIDRVGMTPEAFDAVCTAHGMASPEVYIAEHGALAAERMMLENKNPAESAIKEIDFENGTFTRGVTGREALEVVVLQARMAVMDLEVRHAKHPAEPGISMEMIRHFMHDIVHNPVFTDLESFMKAAKYMERSDKALGEAFKLEPSNPRLAEFAVRLTAAKKAGSKVQIDLVKEFFGGRLPADIKLGPTQGGKTEITVEANRHLVEGFWEECRKAMWDNARRGFEAQLDHVRQRMRGVDPGDVNALRECGDLLFKVREMMEVEFRILEHPKYGTTIPPEVARMMGDFRGLYSGFMREHGSKIQDISGQEMKHLKFLEEQLKAGSDFNMKLALATALNYANRGLDATNRLLDFVDDIALGDIRGERGRWQDFLTETHETYWADRVNKFVGANVLEGDARTWVNSFQQRAKAVEDDINPLILNCFPVKLVQRVNQEFSRSVQASPGGQLTMKGLLAFNLYQEIPAYLDAYQRDGWTAVATEFFVRRVPGGAVAQDVFNGDYGRALWDGIVLFVPPAALFQAAYGLGETLGGWTWSWYWSSELDLFLDGLYEGAQFAPVGVDRVGPTATISRWRLERLKYRDYEVDVPRLIETEGKQIAEMKQVCRQPLATRIFPMNYVFDGISKWTDADNAMRETLVDRDTFLALIETMKKNPHVGPKLMDHYRDLWYTRWEQVKLDFVLDLKKRFEDRRAAGEADAAGQIPELDAELQRLARDLRIEREIQASLEARLGGSFVQFLSWIRDSIKNLKREAFDQPLAEDILEKGQRELVHFVGVYGRVRDTRDKAEKEFALSQPEDHGLRLLTTPFQLLGDPDKDEAGHLTWARLPTETHSEVGSELGSIKQRLAGRASLDTEFDRRIEGQVAFHEVWKRLWRHVQTASHPLQGSAGNTDFETWWELWKGQYAGDSVQGHAALDTVRNAVTGGRQEGPATGELPLERFRYHDGEVDRLMAEFTRHYLLEGSELGQVVFRAEALSREMETLCAEARAAGDGALTAALALTARTEDLKSTLSQLEPEVARLSERAASVENHHTIAESETVALGGLASQLERTSLALCEKLRTLRTVSEATEKARLVEEMGTASGHLKEGSAGAETRNSHVREEAVAARAEASALESTLQRLDTAAQANRESGSGSEPAEKLKTAGQKVQEAKSRWTELAELVSKANVLLDRARGVVSEAGQTAETPNLLSEIQALHGRVRFAAERVRSCPEEATGLIEAAKDRVGPATAELQTARASLSALQIKATPGRQALPGVRGKANSAEYLVQHAGGYFERIQKAGEAGELCFSLARDLLAPAGKVTLPDLRGMPAETAKAKIQSLGLTASFRAGDPAPTDSQRFTVQEQFPSAGQSVPPGTSITLRLFDEVSRVTVPDVTGFSAESARAAVEASGLKATLVGGESASQPDLAFTVASQDPKGGQALPPGGDVTLRVFGDLDPSSILSQIDCSRWPGTRPVWVAAEQRPACACPDPTQVWSPNHGACVSQEQASCPALEAQFAEAVNGGDLNTARNILEVSRHCEWFPRGAEYFNQQVQGGQQQFDRCTQLEGQFWELMKNNQVDAAANILLQATDCPFYPRGQEIMNSMAQIACQNFEIEILRACQASDINRAQGLLAQAQQNGCNVSQETYNAVQSTIRFAQQQAQAQRNQQMLQAWSQFMNNMNQLLQQQMPGRTNRPNPPVFPNPGGGGGMRTQGPTGPTGGGGGGGRSPQDCEKQFCPMCGNDVDLLGQSVDPQCMECRRLNAEKISACSRGDANTGAAVATTKVYRVICFETINYQTNRIECTGRRLLNPGDPLPPKAHVMFQSTSWDECKRVAEQQ